MAGTYRLKWRGPEAEKAVRRKLIKDFARLTKEVRAEAKTQCPVRSGDLKKSTFAELEPSSIRIIVGATEDYARFVHEGWKYHPEPNPWLQRAVDNVTATFRFSTA